ncbi:prenyltransferase/squalene oxidase repeat-containing protein [Blautia sp.]
MKNKVISLFLAATMVLSLCPATVRAQTVSEEFSANVAEAAETEAVEGTADPTEEPVVTGNADTAKPDTPQTTEVPEEAEVVGTGKDENTSDPETTEKTDPSGDSWKEDEELKLYGTADQDVDEKGKVRAASSYDLDTVISQTVSWKRGTSDTVFTADFLNNVSSTASDWTVLFLGRLGIAEDYSAFLNRASAYVKDLYDKNPSTGLSTNTPTEWHRLTMAVLAAGGDPTDVGGHDLIADGTYNCLAGAPWEQGMNGAAWALLALDSKGYKVPEKVKYTREDLISYIIDRQLSDGGWSLDDKNPSLDLDITSMVVYALAPHAAEDAKVREAVNRGLDVLRSKISTDGDYNYGGTYSCESVAQAIIAFTSMGIDPATVTNASSGKSLLDGLLKYYSTGTGGFLHAYYDDEKQNRPNSMATDQAMEAIAAYRLYQQGIHLFDFRANANTTQYVAQADNGSVFTADAGTNADLYVGADVKKLTFTNLPIGNYDTAVVTVDGKTYKSGIRGADGWTPVSGEIAVKDGTRLEITVTKQDGTTENRTLTVRTSADAETKAIINRIDKLPDADKLTLEDADEVTSVKEAYDKLTDKEKSQVTNADKLEELVKKLKELETEEEKKLEEKRSALEKKVAAIATPVKIGDKNLVNQYLLELDTLGEWDKKESLSKTLNGYLEDIAARQKLVDALDKDIWNQVDPLRICQDDTATVKKLMGRYAALREDEKKLLQNGESLLEAADVVEALDNGIVPKKVFENLMATKEAFTYTGTLSGGSTYTLTWDGTTVKKASDVKAGIKIGTGSSTISGTQAQVEFAQSGSMNGTVKLSVKTSVKDGTWNLYWLNPDKLTIQSAKTATVSSGKLKMSVTTGGRYWLASSAPKVGEDTSSDGKSSSVGSIQSSKSSSKSSGSGVSVASIQSRGRASSASGKSSTGTKNSSKNSTSSGTSDTTKAKSKGKITSKELKSIKGKDENLQASGKISDSVSYTLTINGEDVKLTKDWTYKLQSDCKYKDDIEQLAVKPLILCTEGSGTFPGQMLLTLKTELDDDDLLLFSYDPENRKAEYVKKVSVKDGKMEFTLKEDGHYFIAKRALAASLDESSDAEKQEIQDASNAAEDVPWDASEETVVLGNGDDTDTGATTEESKAAMVRWVLIGLIALVCCAAVGVVVYHKRKETGKPELSNKREDRKDGGK